MKQYTVNIVEEAEHDLYEIYQYVLVKEGESRANKLLVGLEKSCLSLCKLPNRGHTLPELDIYGLCDFLEIHFKPYRIIYQIQATSLFIHAVLDGRRDLSDILQGRLFR